MGIETKATVMVDLECGGKAVVKKLGRSKVEACMAAAGFSESDDNTKVVLMQYMTRASIVGAHDLKDNGTEVEFSTGKLPLVGVVASEEVYDALTMADTLAIFKACNADIGKDAAKN